MKKTNALLKISLLLISGFLYHSCQICTCKTITCAAFSDAQFDQWIPYSENQQLIYKNNNGTADTILIAAIQKSDSYEGRTGGGYGCGKGCFADAVITGTNMSGTDFQKLRIKAAKTDVTGNNQGKLAGLSINMGSPGFSASALTDTGFTVSFYNRPVISKFNSSLTIGTKIFTNIQIVQLDTGSYKQAGVYKFYFARNTGLVAWENYPDKTLWVKE